MNTDLELETMWARSIVLEAGVEAPAPIVRLIAWILAERPDADIRVIRAPGTDPVVLVDGTAVVVYI